jgi:membrane associated rhomboid family serine protease
MLKRLTPILSITAVCWMMFVVNNILLAGRLGQYGIVPRHLGGLPGIIWAPFLHGSFAHLAANTLPLLILGGIICARGRGEFAIVTVIGIGLSGGLTWLIGRTASHVGASGLIFCYFGYVTSLALFNRKIGSLVLSVVCVFAYGGILRGLLPTGGAISWEAHLAGLVSGVVLAWLMTRVDGTPAVPGEVAVNK